jgi:hypothetical protein
MTKYFIASLTLFAVIFSNQAFAAVSPVSVAIAPPIQFPPGDFNVTGVRASLLWGKHRSVYGIDVGLLGNITEQTFTGIAVAGGFNKTGGDTTITGLQLAGGANINTNKTTIVGLQAALGMNYNTGASTIAGVQLALVNMSAFTDIYGVQAGLYNKAKDVYGLQLGLINVADNLHGIQIGLVNFNAKGPFAISPILNIGF